ncbi:MAG: site-specific integrase [Bacteroidales bacterium]|nr:site-specific integrase [Bacteroidales bacterium]
MNETLRRELDEARNLYRDNRDSSLSALVDSIKEKEVSESFLTFAEQKIEQARATESIGTYRHYQSTLRMLKSYLKKKGKDDLLFKELNLSFLKDYEGYLGRVENQRIPGRKLDKSTIGNYLKQLRKLVYEAVDEEKLPVDKNPFHKFSIKGKRDVSKEKLEPEEITSIIELDLEEGSTDWNTRNAFLFSFYCAGIRAGDLLQLRWSNIQDGRLVYRMGKNGKERNLELVEDANRILALYRKPKSKMSDFIFPFLDSKAMWATESAKNYDTMPEHLKKALFNNVSSRNVILNRSLKKIALKAGIKKNVTMHTSRHSFANLAMKEGIESSKIQGLLAHSSLSTTEGYMGHFGRKEADEALAKVAEAVTGNKPSEGSKEALISALKSLDKETLKEVLKELKKAN